MVKFGGGREPQQCPVCDSRLDYSGFGSPAAMIAQARSGHLPGCPATEVDPTKLKGLTRDAALALAQASTEPPTG